jgi:hypothetical protein
MMKKVNVIAEYGVKTDWDKLDEWQKKAHPYTVKLKYDGRQMTVPFFMGQALTHEPTDKDVLPCLLADYSVNQYNGFEDWANDLGYDPDSRKAEEIYKKCLRQSEKLERLFGPDLDKIAEKYQNM